jgi:small ligand-binding sensory domain FIST
MRLGDGAAIPFSLSSSELSLIDDPTLTRKHLGCEDESPASIVLFSDPYTFDGIKALGILDRAFPGVVVAGGLIGGARGAGTATLVAPDGVKNVGAVGVIFTGLRTEVVVAQGCRPIGDPLIVTRAKRNLIYELGRRPAFTVLRETVETISPSERDAIGSALHVGRVINEYSEEFHTGDFLVRNLIGADPDKGVIAVGDVVRSGQTIQFHVRDREAAETEMRRLLRQRAPAFGQVVGGGGACLMFSCAGRGASMFGLPDHDITVFADETGGGPVAGCFCAGEIGPVSGRSFIHGFTSVIVGIGPC